jgi:hypothetical protein
VFWGEPDPGYEFDHLPEDLGSKRWVLVEAAWRKSEARARGADLRNFVRLLRLDVHRWELYWLNREPAAGKPKSLWVRYREEDPTAASLKVLQNIEAAVHAAVVPRDLVPVLSTAAPSPEAPMPSRPPLPPFGLPSPGSPAPPPGALNLPPPRRCPSCLVAPDLGGADWGYRQKPVSLQTLCVTSPLLTGWAYWQLEDIVQCHPGRFVLSWDGDGDAKVRLRHGLE